GVGGNGRRQHAPPPGVTASFPAVRIIRCQKLRPHMRTHCGVRAAHRTDNPMSPSTPHRRFAAAILGTAAMFAACTEAEPLGVEGRELSTDAVIATSVVPDLGQCSNLQAPAGTRLVSQTYARGVQIYRWDGAAWVFVAPSARLSADAQGKSKVGAHY